MVTVSCLLIGIFLILQAQGTSVRPGGPLCKVNEEHSDCYGHCQATCSVAVQRCTRNCQPGCICQSGFIREFDNGECIKKEACPGCNGDPNAEIGCDPCGTNCDNYDVEPKVCTKLCIINACKCRDGFVKNSEGICVPYEECPPLCGTNEVHSACGGRCQKTCTNKNPICPAICLPGCICQPNYVRDDNTGECIKEDQCPGCNGDPNAETGCDPCGTNCDNYDVEPKICTRLCIINSCKCRDGFVKNSEGICIPYEECPPLCGTNEVHSACGGQCQKTCANKNPICAEICLPGCICQPNYVRDDNTGECIKEDQCPGCNGDPNAETGCDPCGTNCDNYDVEPKICTRLCITNSCKCRDGFVKNSEGICIPYEECPLVCPRNEVVSRCSGHCQRTCTISSPTCTTICQQGCVCRPGYVRDDNTGKCIWQNTCPKIRCGINEVKTNCLPACGQDTCERVGKEPSICNTFAPVACKAGCVCRKNFFRNADNVCTSAANCLKCQNLDEVFGCRRTCDDKKCESLTKPCNIINKRCTEKCFCRKGYARDRGGQCIPIDQCPTEPVRCPVNEEYKCVESCPPKTCQARFALFKCVANQKCVNKCECKDNYLRNKKGRCVLANQCDGSKPTVRCPVNEEYKCVKSCPPNLCRTRFAQFRCRGDLGCVNKCECKAGYLRNNKGRCVTRNQCEKPKCSKNEVFACHITCPPKTCMAMVARIICPQDKPCRERCDCKNNYARNSDGICIPSNQCFPSMNPPPIEETETEDCELPTEPEGPSQPEDDGVPDEDEDDDQQ